MKEWIWSTDVKILKGETEIFGEKPVPIPLGPPQVPHKDWFGIEPKRTFLCTNMQSGLKLCAVK